MKARIVKPQMMYYGEIFINGKWDRVTPACYTSNGARKELDKWKKENEENKEVISEFEI